jgi:hypothetical protein
MDKPKPRVWRSLAGSSDPRAVSARCAIFRDVLRHEPEGHVMTRLESSRGPARTAMPLPAAVPTGAQAAPAPEPAPERAADRFVAQAARKQAPAPQPDLTELRRHRSARKAGGPTCVQETASSGHEQMLALAREAILREFEQSFVPSPEFQDTFEGATWDEVAEEVRADAREFGIAPDSEEHPRGDGGTTFTGRILGLYTEVDLREDGSLLSVYFEID